MINYYSILASVLFLTFFGCSTNSSTDERTEQEIQIDKIITNSESHIQKKYGFRSVGVGIGMPSDILEHIGIAFETKALSKNELRMVLVDSAQIILNEILINEEAQHFLVTRPAILDFVDVILYNHDKDQGDVFDPEISVARISGGILYYKTNDRDKPIGPYKHVYKETYEEALEALKNQNG